MLHRLGALRADYDGSVQGRLPHVFADGADIASWARNDINWVYRHGIMTGTGGNAFEPAGEYTREQSIATMLRLYAAQYAAEILRKKMQRKGLRAEDVHVSYIGLNSLHLGVADMSEEMTRNINEVVLRIAIRTKEKEEAAKLIPEIAPLQLNGPPGASFFGGRAHVQEVIGLWPTLIPRDALRLTTHILEVK